LPRFRELALIGCLLVAPATRGEEPQAVVRQLVGFGIAGSDSGFGGAAQLGIRLSPVLLRLTLDAGGSGRRGYFAATFRGAGLYPLSRDKALYAGIGMGSIAYGFILDDPAENMLILTPEIGVLFGPDNTLGRILAGLTAFVPLGPVAHPRDRAGQAVTPPHVMATFLLSL